MTSLPRIHFAPVVSLLSLFLGACSSSPSSNGKTDSGAAPVDCQAACEKLVSCPLPGMATTMDECMQGCVPAVGNPEMATLVSCIVSTQCADLGSCVTTPSGTAERVSEKLTLRRGGR
jgi:hypothetical protein